MSREPNNTISPFIEQKAYWSALFLQEDAHYGAFTSPEEKYAGDPDQIQKSNPEEEAAQWRLALEAYAAEEILHLVVIGHNKGGLLVNWEDLPGFVPASQLVDFPNLHITHERQRALADLRDRILKLKIIEINPRMNRLIFSERAAFVKREQRRHLWRQVQVGDVITGQVTNLAKFGAFVDIGGVEGLIHISELSWSRVSHPSDILQPGEYVKVVVLEVQRDENRIALSCKRLKEDPWRAVEERYRPGDLVTGVVTNVTGFGAFVMLEEELEGLVHISELAEGSFFHPRNVVRRGDEVTALVLDVNGRKKRLALSLRRLADI